MSDQPGFRDASKLVNEPGYRTPDPIGGKPTLAEGTVRDGSSCGHASCATSRNGQPCPHCGRVGMRGEINLTPATVARPQVVEQINPNTGGVQLVDRVGDQPGVYVPKHSSFDSPSTF